MDNYHEIIKEICNELNIKCTLLSKDWVVMLEKDNKTRFISGYKYDLNGQGLGEVFDDKYSTYDVLTSKNIPIIKYDIVYYEGNKNDYAMGCNSYDYLLSLFRKYNNNMVIKTNTGSCGSGVFHIQDEESLKEFYYKPGSKTRSFSVCPFYDIENEFRGIVAGGKIKLLYKKIKPVVVGDGTSTIKELLYKFNSVYFKDYENDTILGNGEVFEYDWRFNLARGAISSFEIEEMDKNNLYNIFNDILNKLNIKFGSIDVIKTVDNHFYVMEINSGVMMDNFILQHEDGKKFAKEIYKEAIIKMFE